MLYKYVEKYSAFKTQGTVGPFLVVLQKQSLQNTAELSQLLFDYSNYVIARLVLCKYDKIHKTDDNFLFFAIILQGIIAHFCFVFLH